MYSSPFAEAISYPRFARYYQACDNDTNKALELLRNRIAHLEPICLVNKTSTISTVFAKRHYQLILDMLSWLGYDPKELLHEIDRVNEAIQAIESLKENKLRRLINYILANPVKPYSGFPEYF